MRTAPPAGSSFASAYRNADPPPGAASWLPQTLAALRGQRRRTGERAWPRGNWMAHECHRYSSVTCPNRQSTCLSLNLPISKSVVRLNQHGQIPSKALAHAVSRRQGSGSQWVHQQQCRRHHRSQKAMPRKE